MHGSDKRVLVRHCPGQGLGKAEIARRLKIGRRTVYNRIADGTLAKGGCERKYGPRPARPSKLDAFRGIIEARLQDHPQLSMVRLPDEIKAADCAGGYDQVKRHTRVVRPREPADPVVRFETPPAHQAQVDFATFRRPWGKRHALIVVLGHSRRMWLRFHRRQTLMVVIRGIEEAFLQLRGVPTELLFDQMKAVVISDRRGAGGRLIENPEFRGFSDHWGFRVRACRGYKGSYEGEGRAAGPADGGALTAGEAIRRIPAAQTALRNGRRPATAMRSGRLPGVKTPPEFDFSCQPFLRREQIDSLHGPGCLERRENVVFLGPPGVAKTHLAISLAVVAADSKCRIYFGAPDALIHFLEEAHAAGRLKQRLRTLTHPALLVVDEIGCLSVTARGAKLFFQLINSRGGRASTVLTSNKGLRTGGHPSRRSHGGCSAEPASAPLPNRQHPGHQLPNAPPQGPVQGHSSHGPEGSGRRTSADEADVMGPQRANAPVAPLPPRGPGRRAPFSMPIDS